MRKMAFGLAVLALAGCSQEKAAPVQLPLQPLLYPDFAKNDIKGNACAFVATGGGMGAVFMAMEDHAAFKLDDKFISLPVAGDAKDLPIGTHTHYAGPLYGATLTPDAGKTHKFVTGSTAFSGRLVITDAKNQVVYDSTGDAQCKPV